MQGVEWSLLAHPSLALQLHAPDDFLGPPMSGLCFAAKSHSGCPGATLAVTLGST